MPIKTESGVSAEKDAGSDAYDTSSDTKEETAIRPPKVKHARGLLAIGIFKLSKAVFFFAVAMGALNLVHRNLGELFLKISAMLHFDPDGQFASMLQDKIDLVSGHQLRQVSMLSSLYGVVCIIEGVGLMLERTWAEYLTLFLTIGALPIELFEIYRHPTKAKFGVLAFNLLILGYLVWFIRRKRKMQAANGAS